MTGDRLSWEHDGANWPNREAGRFLDAGGVRWHVQQMGRGPHILLLHGTGAATHSWRDLMPILARKFTVTAPDLPGHGFSAQPASRDFSLPAIAKAVGELLQAMSVVPVCCVGHSAGAAILVRMSLSQDLAPHLIVALNGALLPFGGVAAHLYSFFARQMAALPFVPAVFAHRASGRGAVERLLASTGSRIDARGVELYARLLRNASHIGAALAMMAAWDLHALQRDLPALRSRLVLVAGGNDATVPPEEAFRVRDLVSGAKVEYMRGLGHLAHEEVPAEVAALIERHAHAEGILRACMDACA